MVYFFQRSQPKLYKKPHKNSKKYFFCTNAKVHEMTKMLYKGANNLFFNELRIKSTINKWGRNGPGQTGIGANGNRAETTQGETTQYCQVTTEIWNTSCWMFFFTCDNYSMLEVGHWHLLIDITNRESYWSSENARILASKKIICSSFLWKIVSLALSQGEL